MKAPMKLFLSVIFFLSLSSTGMCQSKIIKQINSTKNELMGVWGPSFNENATFWIQQDSIYYPEHFKSYKYIIDKDSIFILFNGWTYKGTYSISNDSLFLMDKDKVGTLVRTVDSADLKSWIKNFNIYYKNLEKHLYDSVSARQNDNIDFSDITLGLEERFHKCSEEYEKTFLGYKLAANYFIHFESSGKAEYREKAKPLFISFLKFKNGEAASQYLKLDTTKVHLMANKWDSFSEKDQEEILRYGLLRGFGNGLPGILLIKR